MKTTFYETDKLSTFLASKKTLLAKGVISQAGVEAKKLGAKKVLVVTDAGVVKAGLTDKVRDALSAEGLEVGVFDGILPEPPARVIDQCAGEFRAGGYDLCLGLGGGSSLDSAKIVSNLAVNPGSVLDYVGIDMVPKKGTPLILVPTTAGTGSEATRVMVLTDEAVNTKKVVFSDYLLPDVSILDPELTLSVPPTVTADTGMDALVHAIETYVAVSSTPYAEILALQAIAMIAKHLPQAYAKGSNLLPRYNMLLAANLSGSAFASGGLGAVHGLAYVLGTEYHMAHGRSNAILLPHVMNYNLSGNLEKFANIAEAMGEDVTGLSPYEAAALSVEAVYSLMEAVNLSPQLTDYGVSRDDLPKLVQGGMAQARLFVPNPRDLTEADVEQIYAAAF
ncbi:MAG: iron-containing alcohol dehydrogenase [Desulfarculaceae bacterium]|nr:iron-containing alcohol dehydrogenase [Desulfarculaceae bacterium]MCF8048239.1 iron-containing alcohol dehydrogenase [Desulfarculaceae bacterium]MCF8064296.1 iron-containing alcohol dehydrogenase [Desulfarculaceae bacterium]MCF8096535.1 iron-containing alcohol dehydrogenase [Desulfarculaceae bacterium]MCF8121789.1 iron-containing alcohol dehydrogenase [Desulfarculaceae bacterium]